MPIGDIAGELLGGAIRFVANVLIEFVVEIFIRGPGYLVCRMFDKNIDADSGWVVAVGLASWVLAATGGYFAYTHIADAIAVDKCLDSGGAYNYQTKLCEGAEGSQI